MRELNKSLPATPGAASVTGEFHHWSDTPDELKLEVLRHVLIHNAPISTNPFDPLGRLGKLPSDSLVHTWNNQDDRYTSWQKHFSHLQTLKVVIWLKVCLEGPVRAALQRLP
jgi:hypothetical protein